MELFYSTTQPLKTGSEHFFMMFVCLSCTSWIPHWLILTLIKCFIIQVTPLKHYTIFIKLSYLSPISILSTTSPQFLNFLQVAENTQTAHACPSKPMLLKAHSRPCKVKAKRIRRPHVAIVRPSLNSALMALWHCFWKVPSSIYLEIVYIL